MSLGEEDIFDTEERLCRFAPLLRILFPELKESNGIIESELTPTAKLAERILPEGGGRLLVKADHVSGRGLDQSERRNIRGAPFRRAAGRREK
ncbi:MAG: hypothetical protein GXP32_02555, partial [Kiritimatiellaeota bacterium]|nr:hypothetical protein [Kiritimatiellota bacterium]